MWSVGQLPMVDVNIPMAVSPFSLRHMAGNVAVRANIACTRVRFAVWRGSLKHRRLGLDLHVWI